jgi:hypothetical protein
VVAKLYAVSHGLIKVDRWVRLYRRSFRLEGMLVTAALLFLTGLLIDATLFVVWAGGSALGIGLQLAALAQTLLIVGAELGMAGFLVVTIDTPELDSPEP